MTQIIFSQIKPNLILNFAKQLNSKTMNVNKADNLFLIRNTPSDENPQMVVYDLIVSDSTSWTLSVISSLSKGLII